MSDEETTPPPPAVDVAALREFAERASAGGLPAMRREVLGLRPRLCALDLSSTVTALGALAEGSQAAARMAQADLDAVEVLTAAGVPAPDDVLALFPAAPDQVEATQHADGRWCLDGTQPRTVHGGALQRALIVARTHEGDRLFAFTTSDPGVTLASRTIRLFAPENPNGPMVLAGVAATPVSTAAWWAQERDPLPGLLRDSAVWFGACVWLRQAIESRLARRSDPLDMLRLGRADVWVWSARLALAAAATALDDGAEPVCAEVLVRRAVAVTATTADTVIRLVALLADARSTDPADLLSNRVAQLQIAMQRHDAEANLRRLGELVADGPPEPT